MFYLVVGKMMKRTLMALCCCSGNLCQIAPFTHST